ncbi:MAG: hypothetical protein ACE5HJ_04595 [Thermoplasmata archaeon]
MTVYLLGVILSGALFFLPTGFVGIVQGCSTTIDGPIPVYVDVQEGHWFDGEAKTFRTWHSCGPPVQHFVRVWGEFKTANYYNNNGYWKVWFNEGVTITGVVLDSDEWIDAGGVGYEYVVIGQFAGTLYWPRYRYPSVSAEIPESQWGGDISVSMYVANNEWDCVWWKFWASCGGTQTYILTG